MKKFILILAISMLPALAQADETPQVKTETPATSQSVKPEQPAPAQKEPVSTSTATSTVQQPAPVSAQPAPDVNKTVPQGPLSLLATPPAQPGPKIVQVKIGAVDIGRISTESAMGKAAEARIRQLQTKLQKQIETRRSQIEAFKTDIERQMPALPPPQRESKAKEFQKKVEEFQKFAMESEKELMTLKEKLTREMLGALEKVATEFGNESKLTAIFVKRELIYVANGVEALDITDQIIKILNEKQPSKAAPENKVPASKKKKTKKK